MKKSEKNDPGEDSGMEMIAVVIFGITGDLAHRKLIPALYKVANDKRVPGLIQIVGFARREWGDKDLQEAMRTSLKEAGEKKIDENFEEIITNARYVRASFDQASGYQELKKIIKELDANSVVFYLSTPPDSFVTIIQHIEDCGLHKGYAGWSRIVVEKPYGRDLESAEKLEKEVHQVFDEGDIYRIDHYLGKETVQNILVLRYGNAVFEPLWNRRYIDHVQITVAESEGIGSRAGYYETSGVVRDMFQNHLLQLLTLTAMEAPVAFNADEVRNEKVKVLRALRPYSCEEVMSNTFRAQYTSGQIDGERVVGYKDEQDVSVDSTTETYMAARLYVDNWRWAGVPFYLRSGKRLPQRMTEVAIQFKQAPLSLFDRQNMSGAAPNMLVLSIQPTEAICLTFGAKMPGPENKIAPVRMDFDYVETFGHEPPDAYERLLLDVFLGDATLFTRSDEVMAQWKFTMDILHAWSANPVTNLPVYESGTWGPSGADEFILQGGCEWRRLNPT